MKTGTRQSTTRTKQTAARPQTDGARNKSLEIHQVLVPIDFSEPSLEAIEFALPLLRQFGAELHLVHVFEPDYPLASMAAMPLIRTAVKVIGRDRIKGMLATPIAAFIAPYIGNQAAGQLAPHIADAGMKLTRAALDAIYDAIVDA